MSELWENTETGELAGPASAIDALLPADPPALRVWTEGFEPPTTILCGGPAAIVVTDQPGGRRALLEVPVAAVAVVLVARLELGPRPAAGGPPIRLAPGAMAILIGRRQAHGHGLEPEQATALQRRLDAGIRHWSVRLETPAGWRRNLEVVDGEAGIWRVRPVADTMVELAPTTTTAVVRELVALLAQRFEAARREDRPAAP